RLPEDLETFLNGLAAIRFDFSLNLFQEKAGALLQSRVQAVRKAGLEGNGVSGFRVASRFMEHLFAIPTDRRGNAWHAVDIYARAARRTLEAVAPIPPVSAKPRPSPWGAGAAAILPPLVRPDACASLVPGEYLVFHPGSAWPGKRWPAAHW